MRIGRVLFVAALLLLPSCARQRRGPVRKPDLPMLQRAYQAAVRDAKVAEPHEISRSLVAVVPHDRRLAWESTPEGPRVLVVTWTDWDGYDEQIGEDDSDRRCQVQGLVLRRRRDPEQIGERRRLFGRQALPLTAEHKRHALGGVSAPGSQRLPRV